MSTTLSFGKNYQPPSTARVAAEPALAKSRLFSPDFSTAFRGMTIGIILCAPVWAAVGLAAYYIV